MLKVPSLSLSALCLRLVVVAFCVGLFACNDSEETGETISLNCAGNLDTGSTFSISGYVKNPKNGDLVPSSGKGNVLLYNSLGVTLLGNSTVSSSSKFSFSGLTSSTYVMKTVITDYTTTPSVNCLSSEDNESSLYLSTLTSDDANNRNVIVLTWTGGTDLDSHLIPYGGSGVDPTHIYYPESNCAYSSSDSCRGTASGWAMLDRDAIWYSAHTTKCDPTKTSTYKKDDCPPETITIFLSSGTMKNSITKACYFVKIYYANYNFQDTGVKVSIFQSNGTVLKHFDKSNTTGAKDTTNASKPYWHVFDLDSNLNLTIVDTVSSEEPTCS